MSSGRESYGARRPPKTGSATEREAARASCMPRTAGMSPAAWCDIEERLAVMRCVAS